jgi:hypothetical protein
VLVYPFLGDCLLCVIRELVQSQSVEDSRFYCSVSNGYISSLSRYPHTHTHTHTGLGVSLAFVYFSMLKIFHSVCQCFEH